MTEDYERILTVKPEVLVYRLPPRPSNRGYRAADWGLDKPSWTGRMRITSKGSSVFIKLEDKISGELFAQAPITSYPSVSVESVIDSSRYFVLKIVHDSGKSAFIGIGFADRGDAFDFNVTLQDHFNSVKKDLEIQQNVSTQPALDLQLKEGQTFKINLGGKLGSKGQARPRTNAAAAGGGLKLPPPPGGALRPPPNQAPVSQPQQQATFQPQAPNSATGDLLGLAPQPQQSNQFATSDWGEFASAPSNAPPQGASGQSWVQF